MVRSTQFMLQAISYSLHLWDTLMKIDSLQPHQHQLVSNYQYSPGSSLSPTYSGYRLCVCDSGTKVERCYLPLSEKEVSYTPPH